MAAKTLNEGDVKHRMSFTIQASTFKLKKLFRKKDAVEGIIKESGKLEDTTSLAIYQSFRFFAADPERITIMEREAEDAANKAVSNEDFQKSPVVKIYLALFPSQIEEINKWIEVGKTTCESMFNTSNDITYQLLDFIFDLVIERKNKFTSFIESSHKPIGKNCAKDCLICGDASDIMYCDAAVCLKCKHFFQDLMRRRTLLSLRCSKSGACFSRRNVDISCRKCRYDRCRLANMVEQYCYTELPELVVRSCLICRKSEETNEIVLGYSLCSDCRLCFDDLLASDKEPDCVNDPECLCATFECPKCVKVKLCQYGFFKSFQMKTHGTEETKCFRPNDCCVCKKSMDSYLADDKEWMDMVVCTECRSFLRTSLEHDNQALYCCPAGEIGRLCPINSMVVRCSYCWFFRCELEGLVERWQICSGDPSRWVEILKGVEYVSDEDDDDDLL